MKTNMYNKKFSSLQAPINDKAKQHNENLPNGGVYNYTNLHVYHYSNNNPIKYIDPDGRLDVIADDINGRPIAGTLLGVKSDGESVLLGLYLMADGANVFVEGDMNIKQAPLKMFLALF